MSDKYAALKQAAESAFSSWSRYMTASTKDVLALLAERDADRARIAELEKWVRGVEESMISASDRAEPAEKRVSELEREKDALESVALALRDDTREARTLTVTLPKTFWYEHDDLARDVAVLEKRLVKKSLREACAAAGISLKIEGE